MKRGQRTLLESAEVLVQAGSWEWDVVSDKLVWSDNLYRIFGLRPGEIVPSPDYVISRVHSEDRARVERLLAEARQTGALEPLSYRIVLPGGEVRHLRATMAVSEERDGRPRRLVGTVQDLTDRYRAERSIAAHLAVSETLVEWDTFDDGAARLVSRLGEALGCVVATMWVPEGETLVMRSFWHARSCDASALEARLHGLRPARDAGLVGRVWESGETVSSVRLAQDSHPSVRETVVAMGLTSALAIPAVHRYEVLAVLGFYSTDDLLPTDRLVRSLTGIGHELGMFLDRHRGELGLPGLTPREVEVLQLAAEGLPAKAIATELGVSPATVRTHFEHIYAKYGVSDRAAAVATGMRRGQIQ
jgi:PAS domain S-box-containing protein